MQFSNSSRLFQNINSTNWQSMRFKLPPPDSNIGWRVEFRSLDVRTTSPVVPRSSHFYIVLLQVQATEFENAAFANFIVLLSRVILTYDLNLIMPMSSVSSLHNLHNIVFFLSIEYLCALFKLEENFRNASKRNAVLDEKFWFVSSLKCEGTIYCSSFKPLSPLKIELFCSICS